MPNKQTEFDGVLYELTDERDGVFIGKKDIPCRFATAIPIGRSVETRDENIDLP